MEEKVLIKGEFIDSKKLLTIATICYIVLFFVMQLIRDEAHIEVISVLVVILGIPTIIMFILGIITSKTELTATDKRVFGKAIFGKRVDLPINQVSAISMSLFKGIGVSTSSGTIKFLFCKNRDEVFDCISKIILDNQNKRTIIQQEKPQSNADELKKYKDLLDSGVITQEEFDAKKKQLLGL